MSWSNVWDVVPDEGNARQVENIGELPYQATVGAAVRFHKTSFVRALGNGALMPVLDDAAPAIKSISQVNLGLAGTIFRYHLSSMGQDPDGTFLQVSASNTGDITGIMYCRTIMSFEPLPEEQTLFTGEGAQGLGELFYDLQRIDLSDRGFDDTALNAALGDREFVSYRRDLGGDVLFQAPLRGSERCLKDAAGFGGTSMDVFFTPYKRDLAAGVEYLMIQADARPDAANPGVATVHLYLGIPLEIDRVTIDA